ncbi:peptidoglycan recognition family protein [Thermoactinomyces sp. CICC 10523]|uniref:peptidoglycan recognition protein family protein n=1 Tax=Thermoactinomyces sp. CICC 10523 TaxID=2767428 RepID=UPI0018DE7104|nr:peptidoglycan recognition family protein [Thermoactinomyces sp. CICC 10523]MBH8597669.1 N-acetylmuramoyl-L-alanine amidase [Thermoactinomyces sp. CICC 10523]
MSIEKKGRLRRLIAVVAVAGLTAGLVPWGSSLAGKSSAFQVYAQTGNDRQLQDDFASAAREFKVPEEILLSVSYNVSLFEQHDGKPSVSGGYGLMHLTDVDPAKLRRNGKDEAARLTVKEVSQNLGLHTLKTAAALLGESPERLKQDPRQNIRGAAALLAQYARQTTGEVPSEIGDWYGAVAKYSGSSEADVALDFADQVFDTINQGVERTTTSGQQVKLRPEKVEPNRQTVKSLHLQNADWTGADCPSGLSCRFIPAAYIQRSEAPGDYSNYDLADRPDFGGKIRYIIIHDTEENYLDTIKLFANPDAFVSAHYVIRSQDGEVTQMVKNKDIAWQAGNWYINSHSIGIEHEGYAMEGAAWYNEQLYRSSAKLVRYLALKYRIPLDRAHIFGHDEVPGLSPNYQSSMHQDPGPFWDWNHYMELLGAPIIPKFGNKNVVTIKPNFQTNRPPIDGVNPQPSNFVYLYSEPSFDAPLLDDPALNGPGTREGLDWGDKAVTGQTYYLAEHKGDWDAIWYGGQKAWFYNPHHQNTVPGRGTLIAPKKGVQEIPVYGAAYPEDAAYPAGITPAALIPLQYKIPAGQVYVAEEKVKGDYYYAKVFTDDPYATHKMICGQQEFYRIHFNHRFAFVRASDVDVIHP